MAEISNAPAKDERRSVDPAKLPSRDDYLPQVALLTDKERHESLTKLSQSGKIMFNIPAAQGAKFPSTQVLTIAPDRDQPGGFNIGIMPVSGSLAGAANIGDITVFKVNSAGTLGATKSHDPNGEGPWVPVTSADRKTVDDAIRFAVRNLK